MAKYQRIKDLRTNNNFTQAQIAEYLHVKQSTYSQYETGSRDISVNAIDKLSDFYNVSIEYILGRTNNPELNK
ncbi:MAG: helix-turn-helix domain-containing protein [Eubacterium sp.]|nr:helix-turn-helix domain-containing protein [Eubacterium sp.]MDE6154820.1 helix-turn-helix domain-containing protein [Eubacterium sp.]